MTPWTVVYQSPLSREFSRPEYLSGYRYSFSRGSSQPRDWTQVSRIAGGFFTVWATREALFNVRKAIYDLFSSALIPQMSTQARTCTHTHTHCSWLWGHHTEQNRKMSALQTCTRDMATALLKHKCPKSLAGTRDEGCWRRMRSPEQWNSEGLGALGSPSSTCLGNPERICSFLWAHGPCYLAKVEGSI